MVRAKVSEWVAMGRVTSAYGIRGWLKIKPFTESLDALADFEVWCLARGDTDASFNQGRSLKVLEAKVHSQSLVAQLAGIVDRSAAEALQGMTIAVRRADLPALLDDEFYWNELIGMSVCNTALEPLGVVTGLLETGTHDVLRVACPNQAEEELIPFTAPILQEVSRLEHRITVDWVLE